VEEDLHHLARTLELWDRQEITVQSVINVQNEFVKLHGFDRFILEKNRIQSRIARLRLSQPVPENIQVKEKKREVVSPRHIHRVPCRNSRGYLLVVSGATSRLGR
jgi:hypothetical protein